MSQAYKYLSYVSLVLAVLSAGMLGLSGFYLGGHIPSLENSCSSKSLSIH